MVEDKTDEVVTENVDDKAVDDKAEDKIVLERTKGHVLDVAPGCLAVDLPAGYIHEGGLHTTAIVREMRGHEEDVLAAKGPIIARLNAVVGNCLVQLGSITEKSVMRKAAHGFTAQDRMALLLAIRRASLGDFYDCIVTCQECKIAQEIKLDLAQIEIVPMPDRMQRERTDDLPSGTEIRWHVIRTEDEEWLTQQQKDKRRKQDTLTLGLLARVEAVGEVALDREKSYRKAVAALKDLSIRDRSALREIFEREEGSIDTKVEFECENCGHTWEGQLDFGQASFFFPTHQGK